MATQARIQLRTLLGDEIMLIPQEGYLEAEIRGDYAGLLSIAAPKINLAGGPGFKSYFKPVIIRIPLVYMG
ncbi:MAG TPA: hypothetical protein ACFYD0_15690 [Candidatus Wunengus sp. YC65]|uniref:hypothetical protein n=1 Tax=Candidatus Wunengus sp. YC65 TaxID=3367701 RepID=UPI004026E71E